MTELRPSVRSIDSATGSFIQVNWMKQGLEKIRIKIRARRLSLGQEEGSFLLGL